MSAFDFVPGQVYKRDRDLHDRFGGSGRSGISPSRLHKLIMIFTGAGGEQHGYVDEFRADGVFWYTGEGQIGDMKFTKGNRRIRDHRGDARELHLFEQHGKGHVRYVGEFVYLGHHLEERRDREGNIRKAIVFELGAILSDTPDPDTVAVTEPESEKELASMSLHDLENFARSPVPTGVLQKDVRRRIYLRANAVKRAVLKRAAGVCEGCSQPAPFQARRGPYLEPHHLQRLADGGPDDPDFVIALCPNCHCRAHHSREAASFNGQLKATLLGKLAATRASSPQLRSNRAILSDSNSGPLVKKPSVQDV